MTSLVVPTWRASLQTKAEAHVACNRVGAPYMKEGADGPVPRADHGRGPYRLDASAHRAIAHVQVAGAPDRHEPNDGEINSRHLFTLLDELGYSGWIGCEYRPKGKTEDGLQWLREFQIKPTSETI